MPAKSLSTVSFVLAVLGCQPRSDQTERHNVDEPASAHADTLAHSATHSDTIHVYVHNVKAGKEADYEQWVREVWMPSVEKAGKKYPEVRQANRGQRLFAPSQKQKDGSSNYVWIFEPAPPSSVVTDSWVFPDSFLVAGGYSPHDAAGQAKALWTMVTFAEGGEVVRKF
jgi:hypothetical protein